MLIKSLKLTEACHCCVNKKNQVFPEVSDNNLGRLNNSQDNYNVTVLVHQRYLTVAVLPMVSVPCSILNAASNYCAALLLFSCAKTCFSEGRVTCTSAQHCSTAQSLQAQESRCTNIDHLSFNSCHKNVKTHLPSMVHNIILHCQCNSLKLTFKLTYSIGACV